MTVLLAQVVTYCSSDLDLRLLGKHLQLKMALSGGPLALPLASGTPDKCLQNNPDIAYNLSCSV